jgi:hypothetical protein
MANGGDVTVVDCIVWGNAGYQIKAFGAPYNAGTSAVVSYSCVEGGFAGTGNLAADPLFANASASDYHLQASSPCIDAGDPGSRLDPDGTRADMGCFPFAQVGPVMASATTYGAGCGNPALAFSPVNTPIIGAQCSATILNAPTLAAGVTMGWSDTHVNGLPILPYNLAALGLPG